MENVIERMRRDWDARATVDAKYYTAFQRRNQDDGKYDQGAADVLGRIRRDSARFRLFGVLLEW